MKGKIDSVKRVNQFRAIYEIRFVKDSLLGCRSVVVFWPESVECSLSCVPVFVLVTWREFCHIVWCHWNKPHHSTQCVYGMNEWVLQTRDRDPSGGYSSCVVVPRMSITLLPTHIISSCPSIGAAVLQLLIIIDTSSAIHSLRSARSPAQFDSTIF